MRTRAPRPRRSRAFRKFHPADVHQPLHATSRFSKELGGTEGNEVKIDCSPGVSCLGATKLRAFWDNLLGPNNAEPQRSDLQLRNFQRPTNSSHRSPIFKIAKNDVYKSPIGLTKEPSTITQDYKDNAERIAKQRIALAGARLAKLLNDAFK
jgi:S1/P1 Nuclease